MTDETTVACQYEWSEQTRTELRSISLWTGMSMTKASELAIHVMFDAVEQLRKGGIGSLSVDDVSAAMHRILKEHPEGIRIVQSVLSSFF